MQYPDTNANLKVIVRDYIERLGAGPRQSIDIMVCVVAFVLLIACSNVANLQLARATGRASEIAIRIAMGASRWQIMRQVVLESAVVALAGGALGFGLSFAGAKLLLSTMPPQYPADQSDILDERVLLFTIGSGTAGGDHLRDRARVSGVPHRRQRDPQGRRTRQHGRRRQAQVCERRSWW